MRTVSLIVWLCAAEYRATILGTVQDPARSAITGAKVRAVKTDTGVPKETV